MPENTEYPIGIGDYQLYFPEYRTVRDFCQKRVWPNVQREWEWNDPPTFDQTIQMSTSDGPVLNQASLDILEGALARQGWLTYTTTFNFVYSALVTTREYTVCITFLDSCADPRFTKLLINDDIEDLTYTINYGEVSETFSFYTVFTVQSIKCGPRMV